MRLVSLIKRTKVFKTPIDIASTPEVTANKVSCMDFECIWMSERESNLEVKLAEIAALLRAKKNTVFLTKKIDNIVLLIKKVAASKPKTEA